MVEIVIYMRFFLQILLSYNFYMDYYQIFIVDVVAIIILAYTDLYNLILHKIDPMVS